MMDLFEKIYKVFGQDTPSRLLYNATVASPTNTAVIIKQYKNWAEFEKAYTMFCGTKRKAAPTVTKPMVSAVTKTAVRTKKK
jgi:hypothetical protein